MADFYQTRASQPEVQLHIVRLTGTGASAPTVTFGQGVTCTRTSEGLYKLTWAQNPGTYLGFTHGFEAATPGDLAGYTVQADTYNSTTFSQEYLITEEDFTVDDLEANQFLNLWIAFKATSV